MGSRARASGARFDADGRRQREQLRPRKQSLYFPENMLQEIAAEAKRLDRSVSWVVQGAWKGARER
jgi:uncharacterized small protein (TIGR04563 family)